MTAPVKRPATYADIEALPPHVTGEIINGVLYTQPRPVRRHSGAASALGIALGNPFQFGREGPGGWVFVDEAELHLGPHTVVADMAGWRVERMTESPDEPYFTIPPDWVFEGISPSTETRDRGEKRILYATYGVDFYWLLDPRPRTLETFARIERTWKLTGFFKDDELVVAPPFDTAPFKLDLLWPFDRIAAARQPPEDLP
jgi:Uma2 family endonuclease